MSRLSNIYHSFLELHKVFFPSEIYEWIDQPEFQFNFQFN